MTINNLYEGLRLKNYIALCECLGIEKKSGKAKILQIKKLERYCDFRREKQQYIITKIYNNPEAEKDGRQLSRKRKFFPYLEVLIKLSWIPEQKYITYKALIKRCGLYNKYHAEYILHKEVFCQRHKLKKEYVEDFFYEYEKKLNEILKVAIINLSKRKEIITKPVIMVKKYYGIVEASEEEKKRIEELEDALLDERGMSGKYARYYKQYSTINKSVLTDEDLKGIKYYYRAFKLEDMNELKIEDVQDIFGEDVTFSPYTKEGISELKRMAISRININLLNYLNNRFLKLQEASLKQNNERTNFRREPGYLEAQAQLINLIFNDEVISNLACNRKAVDI